MSQRRQTLTKKHPAGAWLKLKVALMLACLYRTELGCLVLALIEPIFAIEVEAKVTLSVVVLTFCMTYGGFTLSACVCFLTFALTNDSDICTESA